MWTVVLNTSYKTLVTEFATNEEASEFLKVICTKMKSKDNDPIEAYMTYTPLIEQEIEEEDF